MPETRSVSLDNARQFIPGSFRLIRELVDFLEERGSRTGTSAGLWGNSVHHQWIEPSPAFATTCRSGIAKRRPQVRAGDEEEARLFERDPFIYFYEDFLRPTTRNAREARGLLYAAAGRELHRPRRRRHPEGHVRDRTSDWPTTAASPCSISPAAPARSSSRSSNESSTMLAERSRPRPPPSCATTC